MKHIHKTFYTLGIFTLLLLSSYAQAETLTTSVIELNNRQAEDVIPIIEPFLHPKGAISGKGFQIIVKTSAANLRDIKQLIAELDAAMRELLISVSMDQKAILQEQSLQASGKVKVEKGKADIEAHVKHYGTQRKHDKPRISRVRVTEGLWATISTGESVPVGQRTRNPDGTTTETIVYKSVNSGFKVLPRISGDHVTLFVKPSSNRINSSGSINTQKAETTLRGKLGEWLLIGGAAEVQINQPGSRIYSTQRRSASQNSIYIKVEVVGEETK
ncbi:MAG: hypothetical protein OEY00_06170 [Gammaproteobacteria bacterium]|nr:hypothetical protein [Gammaproteobacteria bacterium]